MASKRISRHCIYVPNTSVTPLHSAHIMNRWALPVHKRHPVPCGVCGKPTRTSSGVCSKCQKGRFQRVCAFCGALTTYPPYCELHRRHSHCTACGRPLDRRGTLCIACADARGYLRRFRNPRMTWPVRSHISAELKRTEPPCRHCGHPATLGHHPLPLGQGDDLTDWIPLCRSCHAKVHAKAGPAEQYLTRQNRLITPSGFASGHRFAQPLRGTAGRKAPSRKPRPLRSPFAKRK